MPKKQKIFIDNPIASSVDVSTGTAPTPYLVQDGEAVLIFGSVNADLVQPELVNESIHPVATSEGRVAAGFIIADFRSASMGPHSELQFFNRAHNANEAEGSIKRSQDSGFENILSSSYKDKGNEFSAKIRYLNSKSIEQKTDFKTSG